MVLLHASRVPGSTQWKFSVFQDRGLTAALGDVGRLYCISTEGRGICSWEAARTNAC